MKTFSPLQEILMQSNNKRNRKKLATKLASSTIEIEKSHQMAERNNAKNRRHKNLNSHRSVECEYILTSKACDTKLNKEKNTAEEAGQGKD